MKPLNRHIKKPTNTKSRNQETKKLRNKETEKLAKLNEDLVFGKDKVSMFEGLVKYDESQITMLRFFKNLAMLFAILFTALFGGMLLSVAMSYLASLFYNAFKIRTEEPVYIMSLIICTHIYACLQPRNVCPS